MLLICNHFGRFLAVNIVEGWWGLEIIGGGVGRCEAAGGGDWGKGGI